MKSARLLLFVLLLAPAHAAPSEFSRQVEASHQDYELGRYSLAEAEARAALASATSPAQRFLAQSLLMSAEYRGLEYQESWRELKRLEASDRSLVPRPWQIDFYLIRAAMTRNRGQGELARKNEEEALTCAQGDARWLEVCAITAQNALGDDDTALATRRLGDAAAWARQHNPTPFQLGLLARTQAALLKDSGQIEMAIVSCLSAREHFRRAHNPWKAAQADIEVSVLEDRAGHPYDWRKRSPALLKTLEGLPQLLVLHSLFKLCPAQDWGKMATLHAELLRAQGSERLLATWLRMEYAPDGRALCAASLQRTDLTDYERLIYLVRASRFELGGGALGMERLAEAQKLADRLRPEAGDLLLAQQSPSDIRFLRAILMRVHGQLSQAKSEFLQVSREGPWLTRILGLAQLTSLEMSAYNIDEARRYLRLGLQSCQAQPKRSLRALGYMQVFIPFLQEEKNSQETPGQMLLASLKSDPELLESALNACEDWCRLEEQHKDLRNQGYAYLVKGFLLVSMDREAEALEAYTTSRDLLQKGGQSVDLSAILPSLGRTLIHQGRVEEGLAVLRQAAHQTVSIYGYDLAGMRDILAQCLAEAGHPEEALEVAQQALAKHQETSPAGGSTSHAIIAKILAKSGQLEKSEVHYRAAEHDLEVTHNELGILEVWRGHARLLVRKKRTQEAEALLVKATEAAARMGVVRLLPDLALQHMEISSQAATLGLESLRQIEELSLQQDPRSREYFFRGTRVRELVDRTVELWSAQSQPLQVQATLALWKRLEASPGLETENGDLSRQRGQLADLRAQMQRADATQRQSLQDRLAQARQDLHLSLQKLRQRNSDYDALVTGQADDLLKVQACLGPHDVAVQIYPGQDAIYYQVITPGAITQRELRVPRKRVFEVTRALREQLASASGKPEAGLKELSALLIHPIEADLPARGGLWLLPTSELWYVPWDALQRSNGETLLATLDVATLTPQSLRARPAQGSSSVTVGSPDEKALPQSWVEARAVAQLLGGPLLLGPEATPEKVIQACRGASIVHFATHSQVDPQDLSASSLSLFGGQLTEKQAFGLPLAPGALVVLSSCQSGVGEEHPGREVTSLASAFHLAGASTVISTLWRVDDGAQAQMFPVFYRALQGGASRSHALGEAKRSLRSQPATAHPYFWAPQFLLGDPR